MIRINARLLIASLVMACLVMFPGARTTADNNESGVGAEVVVVTPPPDGGGGSPGGGSVVTGNGEKLTYSLMHSIGQDGTVWEEIEAQSADYRLLLLIPMRTVARNRAGAFLSSIAVTTLQEANAPPEYQEFIGGAYDLGPAGATFDPPIALTIKYDASFIPEGAREENLFIALWDEDAMHWVPVTSTLNEAEDTITTLISHFSTYTVMAKTSPASFVLSDLSVAPVKVKTADEAIITVRIANAGDLKGTYEVILMVDGIKADTKVVEIDGKTGREVTFTYVPVEAGSHSISIGSLTALLESVGPSSEPGVVASPVPPATAPAPPPAPSPASTPEYTPVPEPVEALPLQPEDNHMLTYLIGIIGGVVVISAPVYLFRRRKRV